jgi:hypothetical protein
MHLDRISREKPWAICYTYCMTVPYDPEHITYFAETDYRNQRTRFGVKSRDRTRHMYVIGKSGVGKSTLLENMAIQDIARGEGLAVLDPHGSFAEKMLDYIPEHRIKDVIYFAPFDTENPISFNVLEDVGADKRHFVASGLMSTFKKIWVDAWSARMEYILNNILLALLESPDATLLGVNRMLSDKAFRDKTVANITDPGVKAFWVEEFAKYGDRYMQEAGAAIQNKIGQFTASPLIRNLIGQPKSSFDIREAMDNQKILIVNLSKGRIGEQNTSLLGSMIITKIYLAAMSRADASPARMAELPNFYFYVDEFQSFANESFANILSEARKYKLALVIAHQYVAQMEESVRDAVFGNVGTSISFRVGPLDGELLEKVFAPQFSANDLVNLGMAQIYLSLLINDMGSSPFSARTLPPVPKPTITYRNDVIESSRAVYAQPRDIVEKNINDWFGKDAAPAQGDKPARAERSDQPRRFESNNSQGSAQAPRFEKKWNNAAEGEAKTPYQNPAATHAPFKKAFSATPPSLQLQEQPPATARVFRPITKTAIPQKKPMPGLVLPNVEQPPAAAVPLSPSLSDLISSLDGSTVPAPTAPAPAIPFTGEKPLRENIPPVKLQERGATEKNRDLLKAALQNIAATAPKPSATPAPQTIPAIQPIEIAPAPVPVQVKIEVQQVVTIPAPQPLEPVAATPAAVPAQEVQPAMAAPAPASTIPAIQPIELSQAQPVPAAPSVEIPQPIPVASPTPALASADQPQEIPYQTLRKVLE